MKNNKNSILKPMSRFCRFSTRGANLVEYSVLAGLVSVAAIVAVLNMGSGVRDVFSRSSNTLLESNALAAADEDGVCGHTEKSYLSQASVDTYLSPNIWNPVNQGEVVCVEGDSPASASNPWLFTWELPDVHSEVIAYPEVVVGQKPWDGAATSPAVTPLNSAEIDLSYAYSIDATGTYSASLSTWVLDQPESSQENITAEIMIWVENSGQVPGGELIASGVSLDGGTWDLWADAEGITAGDGSRGWDYFAFVRTAPQRSGTLSIDTFTDYLSTQGMMDTNSYLASLEFGFEVVNGSGTANMTNFSTSGLTDASDTQVQPFFFTSVSVPWDQADPVVTSDYVDIPGLNNEARPFFVTSSDGGGTPNAISNVESGGSANSGRLSNGTNLQVFAPYEGETRTVRLNVDGVEGTWDVTRAPAPSGLGFAVTDTDGQDYAQVNYGELGINQQSYDFTVSGTGGTQPYAQSVASGDDTAGRTPNWGLVILNTPPESGETETITLNINGDVITYQVTSP